MTITSKYDAGSGQVLVIVTFFPVTGSVICRLIVTFGTVRVDLRTLEPRIMEFLQAA